MNSEYCQTFLSFFSLISHPLSSSPNTCIFPSVSFTLPGTKALAINKTQCLPSGNLVGKPKNQSIYKSKNCRLVGAEKDKVMIKNNRWEKSKMAA